MKTLSTGIFILLLLFNNLVSAMTYTPLSPVWGEHATVNDAIASVFGENFILEDGSQVIELKNPDIAENGAVIPVEVKSALQAKTIALFKNRSYYKVIAISEMNENSITFFSTRFKSERTTEVIAVVETLAGQLYVKKSKVKVTVGGCGGDGLGSTPAPSNIGVAVGGAKDSDNFIENINRGFLPKLASLTYEGTFYQHYFDTGLKQGCDALFCPSYSRAIHQDIYTGKSHYYLTVGLNSGIKQADFKRKKLNLVVVLDKSGSMEEKFNQYAYDKKPVRSEEAKLETKMQVANQALISVLEQLNPEDRLGIVTFNEGVKIKKTLRPLAESNREDLKATIAAIRATGATDWRFAYHTGLSLFDNIEADSDYENRIVFITDAMPNRGELSKEGLFGMTAVASDAGIHTSFIGVGVDFNADLVEHVSKIVGANYYSVHSSADFKQRMSEEFAFMVSPLAYNLELNLQSQGYRISKVFGSPEADLSSGQVLKVNTLFPSASKDGKNKGGIILLQLEKTGRGEQDEIELSVRYQDAQGRLQQNQQRVRFDKTAPFYDNSGIRKGILLADYVTLLKDWLRDSRATCYDKLSYPAKTRDYIQQYSLSQRDKYLTDTALETWERRSCKLRVSEGYKKILAVFKRHYEQEMQALADESLATEKTLLLSLLMEEPSITKPRTAPRNGYQTRRVVADKNKLPQGKNSIRVQAKRANGIVKIKALINHPNTSFKYAKKSGKAFNYIEHIKISSQKKTLCEFYTSQNLSKNPYFSCQVTDAGINKGDPLLFQYSDLKGRYQLKARVK